MKKLIFVVSIIITFFLFSATVSYSMENEYVQKYIPCPEGEEYFRTSYPTLRRMCARFADDKTPIPLCDYYDGNMWVTIHKDDIERPIEYFISDEIEFKDADISHIFYLAEPLSYRGVIKGNENGELMPAKPITRAEAAAMIMRFIGLDRHEKFESDFDDVKKSEWYYDVVSSAYHYGIIEGDSATTFSPQRLVTREELNTMAARAAVLSNLRKMSNISSSDEIRCPYAEGYEWKDRSSVSDWALNSYDTLYTCLYDDMVETGTMEDEFGETITYDRYLNPQKYATRGELVELLHDIMNNYLSYPSQSALDFSLASCDGFEDKMPKIDGSTSTYPFTEALYRNLFSKGFYHIDKPEKHSKSHVSYQKLINGEIDMMFASVYPSSDILELAKEKGVELELIPIAYDAMIFFTNIENPAEGLTTEQIKDIYVNNTYSNWKDLGGEDANLYPYCRNNDSGSHAQMERHFLEGNEIHETIKKETTSVTMANILTDVMGAKTDDPKGYGLGYSIYYYFNNMDLFYSTNDTLKLLKIDSVAPNDETIASGEYPLSNNTYIVIRKDTPKDSPARKVAEFMLTDKGQDCVEEAGFGRLKK